MQENAARVRSTRALLTAGLARAGFQVLPSETNFVLARRPGENLGPLQQKLKEKGVLVRYFDDPALRDALRITVGTPEEVQTLFEALGKIDEV
jgi:histidinol-phosphate aminotransferase